MYVDHALVSTGDPRKDRNLALLRHSGTAVWAILGMIILMAALRWAISTELGYMATNPIKKAGGKAFDVAFDAFKNHTWKIGPALIAAASLFKRHSTGNEKLSSNAETELKDVASSMRNLTIKPDTDNVPTIQINAAELFALAKILKKEIGLPDALSDELSTERISKLLGNMNVQSDVRWKVVNASSVNPAPNVSQNGLSYGKRLNAFLASSDIDGAIDFGCTMLALQAHTGDAYDDQADATDYIAFVGKKSASDRSGNSLSEAGIQISDSFLQNLKNVLAITDDGDLAKAALLDEAALKDIASGHIRTELKLREAVQKSTSQSTRRSR